MLMFRFWSSDYSRGSDHACHVNQPMCDDYKPVHTVIPTPELSHNTISPRPPKRRRQSSVTTVSTAVDAVSPSAAKRPRPTVHSDDNDDNEEPHELVVVPSSVEQKTDIPSEEGVATMERALEVIENQLGLEVLLKHEEWQLINQEIAKCQVALEQMRRCHLIPYPVSTPTPGHMLDIAGGSGPALQPSMGEKLPPWAPPFGVTDGPYARHYAKWLIPDPKFDGVEPTIWQPNEPSRPRNFVEGRSTRNSFVDAGNIAQAKGRPSRGNAGQKLQSLSSGYPQPKGQAGPCVLKRSDGKTVKLVCIDCQRENFSSTQGFINHCRIAHKRDFKSHDEAAIHCGHPIEAIPEAPEMVKDEKKVAVPTPLGPATLPGQVHPFARHDGMSDSEACLSVVRRIEQSMAWFRQGKLPHVTLIPGQPGPQLTTATSKPAPGFAPSSESPHLSRLLANRGFHGDLNSLVSDATTKIDLGDALATDDDESDVAPVSIRTAPQDSNYISRARVPASAATAGSINRPASSKGTKGPLPYVPFTNDSIVTSTPRNSSAVESETAADEDMLEADLSPNTAVSNNAPSLVSDDGEFDDSVADSESDNDTNDRLDAESISDLDEIDIEEDHNGGSNLAPHRGSNGAGTGTTVRLRKDESKHVTFVSPVKRGRNVDQKHNRSSGREPKR